MVLGTGAGKPYIVANAWYRAHGAFAHMCVTLDAAGNAKAFMNGREIGTGGTASGREDGWCRCG